FWHWALGADGGHGHAQPPFRSSRLIGAERQTTSDCRQSLQQSLRRHAHLALVHTSIENSRDWCRSLLILNCQELAAQQPAGAWQRPMSPSTSIPRRGPSCRRWPVTIVSVN